MQQDNGSNFTDFTPTEILWQELKRAFHDQKSLQCGWTKADFTFKGQFIFHVGDWFWIMNLKINE